MIASITAVRRDGSSPPPGRDPYVPTVQPIDWPLGEDGSIVLNFIGSDGNAEPITGAFVLTVRRRPGLDEDAVIVRPATILNAGGGPASASFPLMGGDTSEETWATYSYDVFYVDSSGLREQVVPVSPFKIRDVVGFAGEAPTVPGGEPPEAPPSPGVLALTSGASRAVVGQNEQWVDETTFHFGLVDGPSIFCTLAGLTEQTGGAEGTYRVRIGGTPGVADGTEVLVMNTTHANFVTPPDAAASSGFARPSGPQLVKLTARASFPGSIARIRHYQVAFKTVT